MIKKCFSLIIALLLCLSLAGCMTRAEELDISSRAPGEENAVLGITNPAEEMSREELIEKTGIDLGSPEGAEDIVYSLITLTEGNPVTQMQFTLDGARLCLRAQSVIDQYAREISGLFYEWKTQDITYVNDCPAMAYCSDEAGYIKWIDVAPGIQYSLSMTEGASTSVLKELAVEVFVPVQGEE